MGHSSWHLALATCLLGAHCIFAELFAPEALQSRRLSAATVPLNQRTRRSESRLFTREATFDFIEDVDEDADTSFVSTVAVRSQQPFLALEDIETDLSDIYCSDSLIELSFISNERLQAAKAELYSVSDFIAVTSHFGCNGDGERGSYKISKVAIDEMSGVVSLSSSRCEWREAFPSMDVSFARRDTSEIQRRRTITKRQIQQGPETTKEPKATVTRQYPTTPTDTTELSSNSTDKFKASFIDKALMPPDNPVGDLFMPQGVVLSCSNCTIAGDVDISQGSFSVSNASANAVEQLDDIIDDVVDFFTNGTVEVNANGLFTHMELGVNISAPEEVPFNVSLPPIPLTPFAIPGIVAFGPMIVPEFVVSFSTEASANFSHGFNISVPDGSSLSLNVTDIANSTMQGFNETSISALPFQSTTEIEQSITFSVSFTPQILLGVNTAVGIAKGGIGASFDLPKFSVEISQLDNVDSDCNPLPENEEDTDSEDDEESLSLGNFTSISPSVELNFRVFAELELDVGPLERGVQPEFELASKEMELPGLCLGFDEETKSYQSADRIVSAEVDGKGSVDGTSGTDGKENSAVWSGYGISGTWKWSLLTFVVFIGI